VKKTLKGRVLIGWTLLVAAILLALLVIRVFPFHIDQLIPIESVQGIRIYKIQVVPGTGADAGHHIREDKTFSEPQDISRIYGFLRDTTFSKTLLNAKQPYTATTQVLWIEIWTSNTDGGKWLRIVLNEDDEYQHTRETLLFYDQDSREDEVCLNDEQRTRLYHAIDQFLSEAP
jgi:hypothetical protein